MVRRKILTVPVVTALLLLNIGCAHTVNRDIVTMANFTALGAAVGQIAATSTQGTLIGAGIGLAFGALVNLNKDKPGVTRCHKVTIRDANGYETVQERCDSDITYGGY